MSAKPLTARAEACISGQDVNPGSWKVVCDQPRSDVSSLLPLELDHVMVGSGEILWWSRG